MAEPTPDDPLLAYRGRFPILGRTNYLISNSLGAVPEGVEEALRAYFRTWADRGVRAWEESWWEMASAVGDLVAPLIGAGPGEVVFQPSVTIAHAVLFSCFDYRGGRPKVVTDAMHFPSVKYLIDQQCGLGAEVVDVPSEDGIAVDSGRVAGEIDDRTAFVNVSHVLFKSSFIHDVNAIAERARGVGAVSIVDGYQAVGAIPVDVKALGVDAYIGGCLKWLCGGPGAAFLWVRPGLREVLAPRLTGWMAHPKPFAFEPTLERRADAWRFLHGTPNIPALHAARPGLEIIREAGIGAIREKSIRQTGQLIALAGERGYRCNVPRDPDRRGGTVALDVPNGLAVSRALKAREILCDYRPGAGIRLSPHFYTRDEELEEAVGAISEILESGSWRTFAGTSGAVT
ncbi:aminotransferase class V-fold PLP-dependent enzyme [Tautonia plasticadhaerens]|uniref:Kynureninase n=1 Tax=Tautonia plasticadhaerens TaxID=2527974 RepID=A0A518H7P1_9BACT|nr:aminotransferase class V-fold PLP-dependent enzyme [Tautonia plasticadhaerens]QDV36862.1 Kynureninase [Tautonia plasticadhaerens]